MPRSTFVREKPRQTCFFLQGGIPMQQPNSLRQILNTLPMVILGNVLFALTVKLFLLPGELVTGGTNGIAIIIDKINKSFFLIINLLLCFY